MTGYKLDTTHSSRAIDRDAENTLTRDKVRGGRRLLNLFAAAAALCCFVSPKTVQAEPAQLFFTVDTPNIEIGENWKTRTHIESRFPDGDFLQYYRLSQKFYYSANKTWALGFHPVIERKRSDTDSSYKDTYRLDFEANPKWKLNKNTSLSIRNRWEVRWKEGKGSELFHRARQQVKLSWGLNESVPFFKSFAVANEIFYEIDKSKFTLNRFYPVSLGLKSNLPFSPSMFYMYQSKRSGTSADWNGTHVFGFKAKF